MSFEIDITLPERDVALRFETGEGVCVLFGPSGAGKTSVVQAVAGLVRPSAGRIAVGGHVVFDASAGINLPPEARRIGYVFQDGRLFPHLRVAGNLDFAARFGRRPKARDRLIAVLGLETLLDRFPRDLSGGEKQRVAIGRALLADPLALCLDEPLAALDERRRLQILPYLERLRDEFALPMLYVTHDISEAARMGTSLVLLAEGRLRRAGGMGTILADPEAVRDLGPRAAGAVLHARVGKTDADGLVALHLKDRTLRMPRVSAPEGAQIRLRIAAQDVIIATRRPEQISALNILDVTIAQVYRGSGPGVAVRLDAGGDALLARLTGASFDALELREGQRCFAIVKATAFDPAGVGT